MNIEALIEDLEAQGYFESHKPTQSEKRTSNSIRLLFNSNDEASQLLFSPLIGTDFICGVTSDFQWQITPICSLASLTILDNSEELLETEMSFTDLVTRVLIGVDVKITFNHSPSLSGRILGVSGQWLALPSIRVPLVSIRSLVVENLSAIDFSRATLHDGDANEEEKP
jgi:hypothetical protein